MNLVRYRIGPLQPPIYVTLKSDSVSFIKSELPYHKWHTASNRDLIKGAGKFQWYSSGLRAGWSEARVPVGAGKFSLHHRVWTGSGAHPASYPMGNGDSYPRDRSMILATHLHLVPRSRMRGDITPLPPKRLNKGVVLS